MPWPMGSPSQHGPEHKKRILRIALKEIIATSEEDTIRLVLHWQRRRPHANCNCRKTSQWPTPICDRHRTLSKSFARWLGLRRTRGSPRFSIRWVGAAPMDKRGLLDSSVSLRHNHSIAVYKERGKASARRRNVRQRSRRAMFWRHADRCVTV